MAKQKNKKWSDYLWLISATYFILGFFNIVFAWLGVICFLIPLLMAIFGGGKGYCNNYCGRGQLFLQIGNTLGWSRKKAAPRWFSSKWLPPVLHVLLHTDDHPHHNGGKGHRRSPSDHPPAMDLQRAMALGLPGRD